MRLRHQLLASAAMAAVAANKAEFDWESIAPSRHLEYHDCYEDFKCARLQVPLDWRNASDSRAAAVAIIKLPAVVPDDDPTFGGSILTNPGGPGVSGVDFALRDANHMQRALVDKPGRRHYEIVSFDPRGIGRTTPRSDCFHANMLARTAWTFETRGNGDLASGLATIDYGLAMTASWAHRCRESEEQWGEAMRYVNTPSVARDMVEMVDKIDELRKREAAAKRGEEPRLELRKRNGQGGDEHVPRLQYIGYSYGTVLGNYFAALFPGRVGRLVLDGVVNANDYSSGAGWLTNLVDTDEIFDEFWDGCFIAGPSVCALARANMSVSEARGRYSSWIENLDEHPLPASSPSGSVMVLTGSDVRRIIGAALYNPLATFKNLAETLDEAMAGNATRLAEQVVAGGDIPKMDDVCPAGNHTAPGSENSEAGPAVYCGDGDDITGHDVGWWHGYVNQQLSLSKILGSYWSNIRFACSSWPFKPSWSFKGPFETPKADPGLVSDRPAAPLLFLTSRLDPVTPLSAAREMAKGHPGSALVIQNSLGHCTFGRGPSQCTHKIVADYFDYGTVPDEKETFCETSCGPWDGRCDAYEATGLEVGEGHFRSMYGLDEPLRRRRFPLGLQ